jgi:hypothetical protein
MTFLSWEAEGAQAAIVSAIRPIDSFVNTFFKGNPPLELKLKLRANSLPQGALSAEEKKKRHGAQNQSPLNCPYDFNTSTSHNDNGALYYPLFLFGSAGL